jgi:hypothetical protein
VAANSVIPQIAQDANPANARRDNMTSSLFVCPDRRRPSFSSSKS